MLELNAVEICSPEKLIVSNLNVQFKPGQIWGILGRNGSGKTTMLHTISGLSKVAKGNICLNGKPFKQFKLRHLAQYIGILLQNEAYHYPNSVWQSVMLGRYPYSNVWKSESLEDVANVEQALTAVELQHLAQRCVTTLSGGERRRVAIATLFAQTPKYYLLDEPLHQLDIRLQIKVLKYLQYLSLSSNKCTIMSLHDPNLAMRFCDHFILLFEDGSHEIGGKELLYQEAVFERLYQQSCKWIKTESGMHLYI